MFSAWKRKRAIIQHTRAFHLKSPSDIYRAFFYNYLQIITGSLYNHVHQKSGTMPSVATEPKEGVSKAGITTDKTGQRHIPASTRPDGSLRKEIRVRPGYRPPEDVEVYKNRTAEAWKNRGKGPIPGSESLTTEETNSAAANKNAKRREARKKAAASAAQDETKPASKESVQEEPVDPEAEKAKEARKLTKKLRQARDLKDKKEQGDTLLPEQFEKVIKINELIRQLEKLGFDSNGDKKTEDEKVET